MLIISEWPSVVHHSRPYFSKYLYSMYNEKQNAFESFKFNQEWPHWSELCDQIS